MAKPQSATPQTAQLSLPEIVAERERLARQQQELQEKLDAARGDALATIQHALEEFNAMFGAKYWLTEPAKRKGVPASERKCRNCGEQGHAKRNCPKLMAAVQPAFEMA
jgi:hypothetical protein